MVIARGRCRLNQKHVPAAHVLLDHHVTLTVWERADRGLAERGADVFANPLGQLAIGRAAEDLHFWLEREHGALNCRAGPGLAMIKTCGGGRLSRLLPVSMNADAIRIERPSTHSRILAHPRWDALTYA